MACSTTGRSAFAKLIIRLVFSFGAPGSVPFKMKLESEGEESPINPWLTPIKGSCQTKDYTAT